jgi:hypothetical protein
MMLKKLLRRDDRGIGAVEFGLIAPVLISFIIGVSQLGRMFYANADMKNAIAHGARVASVYPLPQDEVILDAVDERLMRSGAEDRTQTNIVHGTDENGNAFLELRMTYSVPLEFIFFDVPPVTLRDSRRVFTQVSAALQNNNTGGTTTGGTTSTTSAGGTTSSTSATSTGGTTSSTSATSTGGTTSSTSTTSAGGTTSSTSATSASSTSTSGSSGNGNGNGNGHNHGKCRRCT